MKLERAPHPNIRHSHRLARVIEMGAGVLLLLEAGYSVIEAALEVGAHHEAEARMAAEIALGDEFELLQFSDRTNGWIDSGDAAVICAGLIDWTWVDLRCARMQAVKARRAA